MDHHEPQPRRLRHSALLELAAIALGMVLASFLRAIFAGEATKFEDLALGAATTSYYASIDGHKIHCGGVVGAEECIDGARARGATAVALWLGNSQNHAINQMKEGDETATPILHRRLRREGIDFIAFSLPNANLEELYLLFTYLKPRLPIRSLILPVTFDDLRESNIRADVGAGLSDPATAEAMQATVVGRRVAARFEADSSGDLAGLRQTLQERSEAAFDGWLDRHSALWKLRPEARGEIFHRIHIFRNAAFGINPQTKRRMIEGIYRDNLAALEAILVAASEADIKIILYIPPLRSDVETPYVPQEYERFKEEFEAMAAKFGATFADFEDLVPARYWGTTAFPTGDRKPELDFMHFQGPGHELLAAKLGDLLEAEIGGAPK